MKYTVDHDGPEGICIVNVSGKFKRPKDSRTLLDLARDIRAETGCSRFLCDMRQATISGSTMDIYATGNAAGEKGLARDYRIAGVYSGDMADHKFLEDVVVNRGYILRVFDDAEKAMTWLIGDDIPE